MPNLTTLALASLISTSTATPPAVPGNGCARSGCNGELCVEAGTKPLPTLCVTKAENACYQYSTCAKDASGQCGWQKSPTFDNCMKVANGQSLDAAPSATTPTVPTLDYNHVGPTGN